MNKGIRRVLICIFCVLSLFSAVSLSACADGNSIEYELGGGFFLSDQTVPREFTEEDTEIVLPVPTRYGYKFVGWTWDGQAEPVADAVFNVAEHKKGITFTAQWREEGSYTVKFNLNYNGFKCTFNNSETVADVTVKYSDRITWLKNAKLVKEGDDDFVGWFYFPKSGDRIQITSSTVFTEQVFGEEREITINAVCSKGWTDPY